MNTLELRTINQLREYEFLIPSYQRGYRWTKTEVTELLNDIDSFIPKQIDQLSDDKTWYCLQPIVVKLIEDKLFEVIDGQQRLTTIYLILYYLNQDFVESKRDKLFKLKYATRTDSIHFLKDLENSIQHREDNIDFYYISNAYEAISEWFDVKSNESNFDKSFFSSKFKFHSKVIWYESLEKDPISIFTRINIGKIPLTNSELIKALFLNKSNFPEQDSKLKLRQLEIANEWDNMENSLQNNKFWYFLNKENKTVNRIEFIFDLMNEDDDSKDNLATFRFFSKKFRKSSNEVLTDNWNEIKNYYQRFYEWFNERKLYHKIGYLISVDAISIKALYQDSRNMKKSEFNSYLDEKIKFSIRNVKLDELQYSDYKEVKKILLLYNILTMLSSYIDNSYFPFDLYETGKWDIEHITSIKSKLPDDKNRKQWLEDAKTFIDPNISNEAYYNQILNIKNRAENWLNSSQEDDEEFKQIFEELVRHFNFYLKIDDDMDSLSNLTLLDSQTNRSYKNAVFPMKRKTIIDRDKQGVFIPICTKNVFLKYFSSYPPKISFWAQEDRDNYEADLLDVLEQYIQG